MALEKINVDLLDSIIIGRVEPQIYAFITQTVPNYLKVGDTYRPLGIRLNEWREIFPNLQHVYNNTARIDNNTIFRDFAVHEYLESKKNRRRLLPDDIPSLHYYSREFFKNATPQDIDEAIEDIHKSAQDNDGRYNLYSSNHLPKIFKYTRGDSLTPRDNQLEVINNFVKAVKNGRKNLLMYAVMRFGKSFTSMCCAEEIDASLVLVVSAKADVRDEWKKTVESLGNFDKYIFADKQDLLRSTSFIRDARSRNKKVVLFLTLQDLQGEEIKKAHQEVFALTWDLLIVDETHFGARAKHYGKLLLTKKEASEETRRQMADIDTLDDLDIVLKEIKARITLHLSGTPYRILMGSEFSKEDIIAFVQCSDIANAQNQWIEDNKFNDEVPEWMNPYFGFPKMIRFAFNPNQSSLERIKQLEATGATTSFSELFKPKALSASKAGNNKFIHEDVVLDLLKVIDGIKNDSNVLGFLDNKRIKEGKLCKHMVWVLPYCASCDAMEDLIKKNKGIFKHLSQYEIINISGVNRDRRFAETLNVKEKIAKCEVDGIRTITLTVNRMLTGNTVPQWDTMIYLKHTSSPEEYDQAIYRLQNPFIDEYCDKGRVIKFNMKPQTILVDFDPERVFRLQERKSQIYNVNTDNNGNSRLRERIETELHISPIITLDHNKLREVTSSNIIDTVCSYAQTRSILEEATDMPVDFSLFDNPEFREAINILNEIDSKKGIIAKANQSSDKEEGDDLNPKAVGESSAQTGNSLSEADSSSDESNILAKKLASYYSLILFFAFLTEDKVASVEDIIRVIDSSEDNIRISNNLGISSNILKYIQNHCNGFAISKLDYKIQRTNQLNHNEDEPVLEKVKTALTKFGRISESEIVTPQIIADEMVALLPDNLFSKGPVLDIASKQGEFTIALLKRFGKDFAENIYSVCTSKLAYEFTRKVYKLLSLPVEHIFDSFTSYDLITSNEDRKNSITKALKDMKFAAVIGNPPYQIVNKNTSDAPIYHLFMDAAFELSKIVNVITPARYIFNAGKTPSEWNKERLQDPHFKIVKYAPNSSDIFPNVDIKGGIAISMRNEDESFGPIIAFTSYPELQSILTKVTSSDENSICDIIYPQNKFNLARLFDLFPDIAQKIGSDGREKRLTTSIFSLKEVFSENQKESNQVKILGLIDNKRTWRWISRDLLEEHPNISHWKVFLPKSNGSGALGEILSNPLIAGPLVGMTQSFISFGAFDSEKEAQACLKYIQTKFVRTLLGILKVTQDNSKDTWKYVPVQDFTSNSDIDWSKNITEIDSQLFTKYKLTKEEISFIEKMIKPM